MSSNGNIYRVPGLLWGDSIGHRWIPLTKASDAELWFCLWSAPEQTVELTIETPVIWDVVTLIMTSLWWVVIPPRMIRINNHMIPRDNLHDIVYFIDINGDLSESIKRNYFTCQHLSVAIIHLKAKGNIRFLLNYIVSAHPISTSRTLPRMSLLHYFRISATSQMSVLYVQYMNLVTNVLADGLAITMTS